MNAVGNEVANLATPRTRPGRVGSQRAAGAKNSADAQPAGNAGPTQTRRPPPGINGFQAPAGSFKQPMQVKLCSAEAIRLAERGFASAQESLYNIAVVLPRHQQEDLDAISKTEDALNLLFQGLSNDIRADLNKVRQKAKEAGIKLSDDNYVPLDTTVDLYTKQAIQLLNIIKDYDEMSCLTFALTFASQMSNTERVRLYSNWRNRLGKFIRSLKYQYLQLRNRGALGHVEEPAGEVNEENLAQELERLDAAADQASAASGAT